MEAMICKNTVGREDGRKASMFFAREKNAAKTSTFKKKKKKNVAYVVVKGGAFRFIPLDVLWGARISSSCGQQNVKSSGFIVITYHARDITLLISAVFKHRRSSGAQTLLIFLGGRFWTKADEFY